MGQYFSQDEAFPVIARVVSQLSGPKREFVDHDTIIAGMLKDSVGDTLLTNTVASDERNRDKSYWASQMIQWFSQRFTVETSDYQNQFDRQEIGGAWAYRPKNAI